MWLTILAFTGKRKAKIARLFHRDKGVEGDNMSSSGSVYSLGTELGRRRGTMVEEKNVRIVPDVAHHHPDKRTHHPWVRAQSEKRPHQEKTRQPVTRAQSDRRQQRPPTIEFSSEDDRMPQHNMSGKIITSLCNEGRLYCFC